MIILTHFDWYGTAEKLKKFDEAWKKNCEKHEDSTFMGRYGPWNKKYHWTLFTKVKDISTWQKLNDGFEFERNYTELSHLVLDVYEGPV